MSAFSTASEKELLSANGEFASAQTQLANAQSLLSTQATKYPTRSVSDQAADVLHFLRVRAPAYGVTLSIVQAGADIGLNIAPASLHGLARKVPDGHALVELPLSMTGSYRDVDGLKAFLEEFAEFSTSITHLHLDKRDIRRLSIVIMGTPS